MITTNLTGNLGNHMWQYSVCRTVAEKLSYDWGINPSPTHDYHRGMNQMYFMDVDFGKPVHGITKTFHEKATIYHGNSEIVNITMMDERIWGIEDNTIMLGSNGAFGGIYQSEKYFEGVDDKVKSWFKIKKDYELEYEETLKKLNLILDEDTCVINFRGGEYKSIPNVLCRREYWRDSVNLMLKNNPKMKFVVITDDTLTAKQFMPFEMPIYHIDIGFDFYVVNKSKWLIISNSTFGWWAAWLNNSANQIFAPKYFSCHNLSDGYWGVGEIYTKKFDYIDRNGKIFNFEQCKDDAINYYKSKNIL